MAVFPGTDIPTGVASTSQRNHLIDDLLTPRLLSFRQIEIHDEQATLHPNRTDWTTVFGNWLQDYSLKIRKNGEPQLISSVTDIDYVAGTFRVGSPTLGADNRPKDMVEATYEFDYFPVDVLESFLVVSVSNVNTGAFGPPTAYTVETAPTHWEGVLTDLAFAMAMERILLDYDLWKYRLIYAVGPEAVYEGSGGDIVQQIETLKTNAEERAFRTLDNEKFKAGNVIAGPTNFYYQSIDGFGGGSGPHGIPFTSGKLRGYKPNKWS
jgi:hypothetical protein